MSASRRLLFLIAIALLTIAPLSFAQTATSGAIAGTVTAADGSALPGVTVEAIHVPTGTRYDAVSGSNGRYTIPNVRVGGPYRVGATLEGFRPLPGVVRWAADGTCGISFNGLIPFADLIDWLKQAK